MCSLALRWSGWGSVIRGHSDHGKSVALTNPLWTRIHRFIWSTMIRVISDHWSRSGSSQRNAPQIFSSWQWGWDLICTSLFLKSLLSYLYCILCWCQSKIKGEIISDRQKSIRMNLVFLCRGIWLLCKKLLASP